MPSIVLAGSFRGGGNMNWRHFSVLMAAAGFVTEYAIMSSFGSLLGVHADTALGAWVDATALGIAVATSFIVISIIAKRRQHARFGVFSGAVIVGLSSAVYEIAFHPMGQALAEYSAQLSSLINAAMVAAIVGAVTAWVTNIGDQLIVLGVDRADDETISASRPVIVGAVFAALCGVGAPILMHLSNVGEEEARQSSEQILNVAGRQRMLSQRIGRLALQDNEAALAAALKDAESQWAIASGLTAAYIQRNPLSDETLARLPGSAQSRAAFARYTSIAHEWLRSDEPRRRRLDRSLRESIDAFLPIMDESVAEVQRQEERRSQRHAEGPLGYLNGAIMALVSCMLVWPLLHLVTAQAAGLRVVIRRAEAAQEDARESESRYRLLAENSTDTINRTNLAGDILYISPAIQGLAGYRPDELLHRKGYDLIHPDDWPRVRREFSKLVHYGQHARRQSISYRLLHKDGREVWVESSPRVVRDGDEAVEFVDIVRDISERKRVEASMLEARDRAETALKNLSAYQEALDSHAIVAVTDKSGRITFANSRFCEISGYALTELLGKSHSLLNSGIHPKAFFVDMWRTIGSGRTWHGEICNRAKDGSLYWVDTTVFPKLGLDGRPEGFVSLRYDITERKKTELKAKRRQQINALILEMHNEQSAGGMLTFFLQRALNKLLDMMPSGAVFVCEVDHDELGEAYVTLLCQASRHETSTNARAQVRPMLVNLSEQSSFIQSRFSPDAHWYDFTVVKPLEAGFWAVPIVRGGRDVGLLAIAGAEGDIAAWGEELEVFSAAVGDLLLAEREDDRRRASEEEANKLARRDALTALGNRRYLIEEFDARIDHPEAHFALLLIDLDRFKPINDTHGHLIGDKVLQVVADRLRHNVRSDCAIARLGGDEFAVLTDPRPDLAGVERLTERILVKLLEPIHVDGLIVSVGASIGVATYPMDATSAQELLHKADAAMYRAKVRRGETSYYDAAMDDGLRRKAEIETEFRAAVEAGEVVPYFQPVVDLNSHEVVAHEVLARWHHPVRGYISPAEFIPIAESAGLIEPLFWSLLKAACRKHIECGRGTVLSINLSAVQVKDPQLAQRLLQALTEIGFPARLLEIEITESAMLGDVDLLRPLFQSLRNQGVRIALDDFGTGYSSLLILRDLPLNKLKIDRSFVSGASAESPQSAIIVDAILGLARALKLDVTVEGVETLQAAHLLAAKGCHYAQGYLFGAAQEEPCFEIVLSGNAQLVSVQPTQERSLAIGPESLGELSGQGLPAVAGRQ